MAETVVGLTALHARFRALESAEMTKGVMGKAASYTRGQIIKNRKAAGAWKTGKAAPIVIRAVTETSAELWSTPVLAWLDEGTGVEGPLHHRITPKVAKVLAWKGGPGGAGGSALRLTGRQRSGKAGAGAFWIVARSTKGMKPRPFIQKSIREAGKAAGVELSGVVIKTWDDAA